MAAENDKELVVRLRKKIRDFEDRKISSWDLGREIFFVARALPSEDEGLLRRALEFAGNRVNSLAERSLSEPVRQNILDVIDQMESELIERGY